MTNEIKKSRIKAEKHAKTSWIEGEGRLWQRDYLRVKRMKLLRELAPDLVCPECGKTRLRPKQWVILKGKRVAVCLACYRKNYDQLTQQKKSWYAEKSRIKGNIVVREMVFFLANHRLIKASRKQCGLSQRRFGELCGWGRTTQRTIENVGSVLNSSQIQKILDVLKEHGVTFTI